MEAKLRCVSEGELCAYTGRTCMQNRLEGYEYCIRHILEDKGAPYKQCNYVYPKNGKRCPNAAAKGEKKDGYCQDHQKKAAVMRMKLSRKYRAIENPETLLEELEYFVSNEENKSNSETKLNEGNAHDITSFGLPAISSTNQGKLFSDPESERELPMVEQTGPDDGDSDAESVDSEQENVLKHAATYTAEEVALFTRDKLIRLQSLYIDQFKRLQYILKEKRRKYLNALKLEKETMGSIHGSPRTTHDAIRQYKRLKASCRYHKRHGQELIMRCREKERRLNAMEGNSSKTTANPNVVRCIYVDAAERCPNRALPLSKHCAQHILFDPHQVLFHSCFATRSCTRPVIRAIDGAGCVFHASLPPHLVLESVVNNTTATQQSDTTVDSGMAGERINALEMEATSSNREPTNKRTDDGTQQQIFTQSILEEVEIHSPRFN